MGAGQPQLFSAYTFADSRTEKVWNTKYTGKPSVSVRTDFGETILRFSKEEATTSLSQ